MARASQREQKFNTGFLNFASTESPRLIWKHRGFRLQILAGPKGEHAFRPLEHLSRSLFFPPYDPFDRAPLPVAVMWLGSLAITAIKQFAAGSNGNSSRSVLRQSNQPFDGIRHLSARKFLDLERGFVQSPLSATACLCAALVRGRSTASLRRFQSAAPSRFSSTLCLRDLTGLHRGSRF